MNSIENSLPTAEEAALARLSSQELSLLLNNQANTQLLQLVQQEGHTHTVSIPASAMRFLVEILNQLGKGNTVKLVPIHAELTTQDAADLLNVSRPTLIKLLDDGKISYHRSGNRRKLKFTDVHQFKQEIDGLRHKALEDLSALDQELDLYE
ncbi:MAG: helix-turn-helix domain-containing protein [Pseudomonadota bacterium]